MRLNSKLILNTLVALVLAVPVTIYAHNTNSPHNTVSTGYDIDPGALKEIDAHGICKKVQNFSNLAEFNNEIFFIPTKTLAEWQAFIANHPEEISITECGGIIVNPIPTESSGSDIYIHYYVGEKNHDFWE